MSNTIRSQLISSSTYPVVYNMTRVLTPRLVSCIRAKSTAPITATHVPSTTSSSTTTSKFPSLFHELEDAFLKPSLSPSNFFSTPTNAMALLRDMDREMDMWSNALLGSRQREAGGDSLMYTPRFDVSEDDESVHINVDLPGVKMEDIDIEVKDDKVLSIRGERKVVEKKEATAEGDEKEQEGDVVKKLSQMKFQRNFSFGSHADPSKINANLADGVLRVTVGKKEEIPANVRKIEVSNGSEEIEC